MKNQNIDQSQSLMNQPHGCVVRACACGVVDVGFAFESGKTKHARFHVSHCIKKTQFEILTISLLRGVNNFLQSHRVDYTYVSYIDCGTVHWYVLMTGIVAEAIEVVSPPDKRLLKHSSTSFSSSLSTVRSYSIKHSFSTTLVVLQKMYISNIYNLLRC